MQTNKVIATDLDGTLFYPRKHLGMISKENRAFIDSFIANGGKLLIVSSRNRYFSEKVAKTLGHPIDTIGCNGSFIISNGETIKETFFQPGLIRKILSEMSREWHLPLVILDSKHRNMVLTQTGVSRMTNIMYFSYQLVQGVYREPFVRSDRIFYEEIEKGQVYKLMIMLGITHKKIMQAMEINKILRERYPEAEFSWVGQGIEVTPKGCSKGEGIAFYLDYNKIDRDNVLVVGDSGNDISMFEEFKENSFCLAHGRDIVKKHAAHTIERFYDLEKYVYPSAENIQVSQEKKEGNPK